MCTDYEPWDFSSHSTVTARKTHKCYECDRTIQPGEKYDRVFGVFDGSPDTYKTCKHCTAAAQWLLVVCHGYGIGGLRDELGEHWDEDPLYRSHWLGRAIIGIRRQWRGMEPLVDPRPTLARRGLAVAS